jgi:hypothetical protein
MVLCILYVDHVAATKENTLLVVVVL